MRNIFVRLIALSLGLSATTLPITSFAQGRSSALLEEIVVTARKREENLQDTPVAVSAFTGDQLDFRGMSDIDNIDQFTPNLVFNKSPTYSNVTNVAAYIRGIGQSDFTPVVDPGVGIYVDGVYLGRSVGGILDIVDVERIEILRGPQGTLFGRNTIGGALIVHSKKPTEEFGGKVDIKYGTDDRINVRGTVNVPITDNLFARFNIASFNQDGYVIRTFDGLDLGDDGTIATRVALRWLPSDNFEVNFTGDYSRDRENGNPYVLTGLQPINIGILTGGGPSMLLAANTIAAQLGTGGPASFVGGEFFDVTNATGFPFNFLACEAPNNVTNPLCANTSYIDDGSKNKNFSTQPSVQELDVWGAALTVEWDINDTFKLKSISSWRNFEGFFTGDQDGTPVQISFLIDIYQQEQLTQELQVLGTGLFDNRLDLTMGAYYFQEKGKNINPVRFSQAHLQSGGEFDTNSWAVFAQGSWHFNDKLDLTFGIRYTEDTKGYLPDQFLEVLPIGPVGPPPLGFTCPPEQPVPPAATCAVGDRVLPFEKVTRKTSEAVPMVNLAYRWNDGLMTYFTYSEGFKSGGYTQRIFPPEAALPDFEPEFVTSYEIGAKYDGWDDRLRFNMAVFYTDYTALQLLVADPTRLGPFVSNAGDAEVIGLEMELFLNPAEGWFITGSAGMTDIDRTRLEGSVQGLTLDSPFQQISKWTANAQIYKEMALGEMGYLTPRFEWSYRSPWGTNSNNIPRIGDDILTTGPFAGVPLSFGLPNPKLVEGNLHILNAGVRWDVKNTGITISGGVDNITDEKYTLFANYQDGFAFTQQTFHRGREWYIHGSYEFGGY